jgi:hypothetical protein
MDERRRRGDGFERGEEGREGIWERRKEGEGRGKKMDLGEDGEGREDQHRKAILSNPSIFKQKFVFKKTCFVAIKGLSKFTYPICHQSFFMPKQS